MPLLQQAAINAATQYEQNGKIIAGHFHHSNIAKSPLTIIYVLNILCLKACYETAMQFV